MKKLLINIWAYSYHAKFEILAEDNVDSVEQSILDKIGEKSIKWEYLGKNYSTEINRITYEEVIDEVITEIKLEEAKIAHRQNTVDDAAPQVSVAT